MTVKTAPELARETLKQLIARRLPPTPINYRLVYNEIGGLPDNPPFPVDELRKIAQALPAKTPGQQKQRGLLEYAVSQLNWQGVHNALVAYGAFTPRGNGAESPSSGFALLEPETPAPVAARVEGPAAAGHPALTPAFFEQIARLVEFVRPALGNDDPRFAEQTAEIVRLLRDPSTDAVKVKQELATYVHRVSFAAEDQVEIKTGLLHLVQLIVENIGELVSDDSWLKGQLDALIEATAPPITLRRLDDVERRLRDVIVKQSDAKGRAIEAQEEMRQMLRVFIERLSQMGDSTGAYGAEMEVNAGLIEQAKSMTELTPVLKKVVSATREIARSSLQTRDELRGMRENSQAAEAQIARLHRELDRVSALARHDTLTGALNRKGLEEALARELAIVHRKDAPLCVAMLDIDNFKKINDERGHSTGDQALAHLAQVARETMRPQDTLARFGGEEFVVLMPDTELAQGIEAMVRLQRELTKRFFLAGADKVLITFSAGVAQVQAEEASEATLRRADQAMYLAKRAGKNRVLGA